MLLFAASKHPEVGDAFTAPAPKNSFSIYSDAKQDLKVTVSKTFSTATSTVYPEYDQLTAGVGDSTFGVSGVRDNCYTPTGSRCH